MQTVRAELGADWLLGERSVRLAAEQTGAPDPDQEVRAKLIKIILVLIPRTLTQRHRHELRRLSGKLHVTEPRVTPRTFISRS